MNLSRVFADAAGPEVYLERIEYRGQRLRAWYRIGDRQFSAVVAARSGVPAHQGIAARRLGFDARNLADMLSGELQRRVALAKRQAGIPMGVKELREAFNAVAEPTFTAQKAFLDYVQQGGTQYSVITFSGIDDAGTPFEAKSNRIKPKGDVILAARETAQALLTAREQNAQQPPAVNP